MDINNKTVLYHYYFMKGFIRAITKEENDEIKTLILEKTMGKLKKWFVNSLFFWLVMIVFFVLIVGENIYFCRKAFYLI